MATKEEQYKGPPIRSAYDGTRVKVVAGGGDSMVREAFKDECDINLIVQRYAAGAQLPPSAGDGVYADVSMLRDYKEAVDFVISARERISELPEKAQIMIAEDPAGFQAALLKASSDEDLRALGILEPVVEPPAPDVEPVVDPAPTTQ